MFGLLMRRLTWPLAIMLSADWVPVKSTRSLGAMAQVGCPDLSGRLAWVRYQIIALSNLVVRENVPPDRLSVLRRLHRRRSVGLVARHHGPGDTGNLVGQRNSGNLG